MKKKRVFRVFDIEWNLLPFNISEVTIGITNLAIPNIMEIDIANFEERNIIDNYIIDVLFETYNDTPISFQIDELR